MVGLNINYISQVIGLNLCHSQDEFIFILKNSYFLILVQGQVTG